jgi:hypothetical protein
MNQVTVRDANMPPNADEFSEEFVGCAVASLIDFSGYDQVELDPSSRDLTAFMTPLGLLRMMTLPQGATNSVAQFMRIIIRILKDHFPHLCGAFIDDVGVKGPRTTYDNEEGILIPRKSSRFLNGGTVWTSEAPVLLSGFVCTIVSGSRILPSFLHLSISCSRRGLSFAGDKSKGRL